MPTSVPEGHWVAGMRASRFTITLNETKRRRPSSKSVARRIFAEASSSLSLSLSVGSFVRRTPITGRFTWWRSTTPWTPGVVPATHALAAPESPSSRKAWGKLVDAGEVVQTSDHPPVRGALIGSGQAPAPRVAVTTTMV